jgi:DNA-binding IclR family transcriptional regulator
MRVLHDSPRGLTLAEVARRVGLPRSTVHRIVGTLELEGFVGDVAHQAPAGRAAVHGAARRRGEGDRRLAVPRDERVLFIDQIAPSRRLRAGSVVGELFPAYCTANGKALLATLSEPALDAVRPRRLPRLTPKTITVRAELLAELAHVPAEGVASTARSTPSASAPSARRSATGSARSRRSRSRPALGAPEAA